MLNDNGITRRQFVASAASAAALPALPSSKLFASDTPPSNHGVIELTTSPYAKLRNVPISAVSIGSGFWGARRAINLEKR
jgi:hypothetical protein